MLLRPHSLAQRPRTGGARGAIAFSARPASLCAAPRDRRARLGRGVGLNAVTQPGQQQQQRSEAERFVEELALESAQRAEPEESVVVSNLDELRGRLESLQQEVRRSEEEGAARAARVCGERRKRAQHCAAQCVAMRWMCCQHASLKRPRARWSVRAC